MDPPLQVRRSSNLCWQTCVEPVSQALIPLWYSGNLELSSQPELKELMSRPGWGDRITCFEVAGLSPTVLEKLRDGIL